MTYPEVIELAKKSSHTIESRGFSVHKVGESYHWQIWWPDDSAEHTFNKPLGSVACFILSRNDQVWRQV